MGKRLKFSDEELIKAVKESEFISQVVNKLGFKSRRGSLPTSVKEAAVRLSIDVSHLKSRTEGGFNHSEETKKKLSELKKKFLRENPNKNSWSRYTNKESKPEKLFREMLLKNNITAVQWYSNHGYDRSFEIDFAIPEKKIAFEVNGNQHYKRDGTLKPYYQERHDFLTQRGWFMRFITLIALMKNL